MEIKEINEKLGELKNNSKLDIDSLVKLHNEYTKIDRNDEIDKKFDDLFNKAKDYLDLELLSIEDRPSYEKISEFEEKIKDYRFYNPVISLNVLRSNFASKLEDLLTKSKDAKSYELITSMREKLASYNLKDTEEIRRVLEENEALLALNLRGLKELIVENKKLAILLGKTIVFPTYDENKITLLEIESLINSEYVRNSELNEMLQNRIGKIVTPLLVGAAAGYLTYKLVKRG